MFFMAKYDEPFRQRVVEPPHPLPWTAMSAVAAWVEGLIPAKRAVRNAVKCRPWHLATRCRYCATSLKRSVRLELFFCALAYHQCGPCTRQAYVAVGTLLRWRPSTAFKSVTVAFYSLFFCI